MTNASLTVMEAIARKRAIAALYNGQRIVLAPHLLFERHGDQFVSALNAGKSWRSDEEPRLGQFKLAGLGALELLDEPFEPLASFCGILPREDDVAIFAV
ncbi:hypothetical protein [Novosphingobium sp.]|nr:hypothetical protein [Novosphingobium sp.]